MLRNYHISLRLLCLLLLGFLLALPLAAQKTSKKTTQKTATKTTQKAATQDNSKELKKKQTKLKQELTDNQKKLDNTRKEVKTGEKNVAYLGVQIDNRLTRIHQLEKELDDLEADITKYQKNINKLDGEVRLRRQRLKAAVRNARTLRENHDPLVFILSAKTVSQMYRRARYAREYVAYQQNLGEQLLQKQGELLKAQNTMLKAKSKKNSLLNEVILQRRDLNAQQIQERKKVAGLRKQESGLQDKVKEQQKQLAALDKKIEEVIAYEIEQARKKQAEAAANKNKKQGKGGQSSSNKKPTDNSKQKQKQNQRQKQNQKQDTTPAKSAGWLTQEEKHLTGTFEQNRGRLPVPITGQYMVGNHLGRYYVPHTQNVQLDNKGTHYIGRPNARARAIFDGVVTSVFKYDGVWNVLVRHGAYISVYSNLSSTIVKKEQKVRSRDILGTVANDGKNNCILHFQLRKETVKLNPEAWIGK